MNGIALGKKPKGSHLALLQQPTEVNRVYPTRSLLFCLATVGLGTAFFLADHNLRTEPVEPTALESNLQQLESGNPLRRVGVVSIGLLGCLLLMAGRGRRFALDNSLSVVVATYIGLCLASVIWADYTSLSSKRLVVAFLCFLGVMGVCRQFSPRDLCRMVLVISSVYLCIGVVAELVGGAYAPSPERFRFGGTLHVNGQGMNCAFLCISAVCLYRQATRWRWALGAMFFIGLVFLLLTGSRTALYSLLFAGAAYGWLESPGYQRALALTALPALATFLMLVSLIFGAEPDLFVDFANLGRDRETVSTMTGRIPLWNELLGHIGERPLLGYGYQGFWSVDRYADVGAFHDWIPTHAHCAYLETILGLGIIGALLHVLAIVIGIYWASKYHARTGDAGYGFVLIVLLMVTVHSVFESTFAVPSCFFSTIFFCALFMLAFQSVPKHRPRRCSGAEIRMGRSRSTPGRVNV